MRSRIEYIFDEVVEKVACRDKDIASIKTVLDACDLQGKAVLEPGCGIGDNLIYCTQKGAAYIEGFDISGKSIKSAELKTKNLQNTVFHKCSIEEYRTNRKFDVIIGWGVFEYFADPLESLKKMRYFLADNGIMVLLISRPIFIKKVSFLCRAVLSRIPLKTTLPVARFMAKILKFFSPVFKRLLYMGESRTYTMEQTILEGLMVPRYNVFPHEIFTDYLEKEGFLVDFFNDSAASMVCMVAKNNRN